MNSSRIFYNAKCFFFLILSIIQLSYPQVRVGEWSALTSTLKINDVDFIGNTIFIASEGGILSIKEEEYSVLTTVNGLLGVDLLSIAKDKENNLWIGGNSPYGFLQLYNPLNQFSITSFDFQLTSIVDIQVMDTITWVLFQDGQDNGLMKLIYDGKWEYRDSFRNYPGGITAINCFSVVDSMIFIGTNNGLYSSTIHSNLKNPLSWDKTLQNMDQSINSIDSEIDEIIFTTNNDLYKYSYLVDQLYQIDMPFDFEYAQNIFISNDGYWFSDGNNLYLYSQNNETMIESDFNILSISKFDDRYIIGTDNGIIFLKKNINFSGFEKNVFIPNSPVTNSFSAIEILKDGRLVGGSDHGLSIYSNEGWRNILEVKEFDSEIVNDEYNYEQFIADTVGYDFGEFISDIEQGPDGLLYCAIRGSRVYSSNPPRWSGGIIVVDIDNPENISTIDTSYLSYHTSSNNDIPYQIVLDIEFDNHGNLWIANPYCTNGNNPIHVRSSNGEWKHYGSTETGTALSHSPISITFDNFNRSWVSSFQAANVNIGLPNGGIHVLTFDGNPYAPNSFYWDAINSNGTVWSLGTGLNDRLYYLTPSGLNYYDLDKGINSVVGENLYPYFPNISFGSGSKLNVDFQGNVWVSSSTQGVYVLQDNTSYWPDINGIKTSNSALLSDEIRDVDFDHQKNLAYIATSKGVSILKIPFGRPKTNYQELKIFPSPYYIPSGHPLIIDGIIYQSSLKVMTLNGKVIKHVLSKGLGQDGQQLSWDGRNEKGEYVRSGVYLLMIYNKLGNSAIEKITVINAN